jgi:hypothetical protein
MRIRLAIGVVLSTALIVPLSVPGAQAAQVNFPSDGTWVVPAGVEVVQVTVSGGKGGDGGGEGGGGIALGGYGVAVTAGLNVSPGETVYMGLGADGQNSTPRGGLLVQPQHLVSDQVERIPTPAAEKEEEAAAQVPSP